MRSLAAAALVFLGGFAIMVLEIIHLASVWVFHAQYQPLAGLRRLFHPWAVYLTGAEHYLQYERHPDPNPNQPDRVVVAVQAASGTVERHLVGTVRSDDDGNERYKAHEGAESVLARLERRFGEVVHELPNPFDSRSQRQADPAAALRMNHIGSE